MKKILKFSLIAILLFSFFVVPQNSSAATKFEDPIVQPYNADLASELVKKQVKSSCGSYARISNNAVAMLPGTSTDIGEPTLIPYGGLEESILIPNDELEESIQPLNVNLTSQIRTSEAGSRIVLPVISGLYNYGYCHLFERHMEYANGTRNYKKNGASQFQYARYPEATMKIIMEVIDGTTLLIPESEGKYSKSKYSNTEKQNVKVILRRGSDVTNGGNFSAYDWVVVTAYPI